AETTTWLSDFEVFTDTEDPVERAVELLRKRGWLDGRVGLELGESFVSPAAMDRWRRLLGRVADGTGLVEQGRRIKSAEELAWIRRACRITEAGMRAALGAIRPGVTENAVAGAAYAAFMAGGSDFMAGDPIVTSGWRSGVAHLTFGNRRLEPGDTLLLEMSACQRRYFGPLMRGAVIPPVPDEARRMAEVIVEAGGRHRGDPARRDERRGGRGVPGADRAGGLRAELPQAHRLLGRGGVRAELGRGAHREPPPR